MANKLIRLVRPVVVKAETVVPARTNCSTCGQTLPLDTPAISPGMYGVGQEFTIPEATLAVMVASGEALDYTPPVISAVADSDPTAVGATITWTTDRPSNSKVYFRVADQTPEEAWSSTIVTDTSPLVTAHTVVLDACEPLTLYDYYVESQAAYGEAADTSTVAELPVFMTAAGE